MFCLLCMRLFYLAHMLALDASRAVIGGLSDIDFPVLFLLGQIVKLCTRSRLTALLTSSGVAGKRVARSLREIERKVFHVAGLLIPLW